MSWSDVSSCRGSDTPGGLTLNTLRIVTILSPHDRAIACRGRRRQDQTVVASEHQLMPQLEDLASDDKIQHEDKNNNEPDSVSYCCLVLPGWSPTISAHSRILRGKAPSWERSSTRTMDGIQHLTDHRINDCAHRHTPVQGALFCTADEKEGECRNEGQCCDDCKVFLLQPAERLGLVVVEDDEDHVDGHGERPKDIGNGEPALLDHCPIPWILYRKHTSAGRRPGSGTAPTHPRQVAR